MTTKDPHTQAMVRLHIEIDNAIAELNLDYDSESKFVADLIGNVRPWVTHTYKRKRHNSMVSDAGIE